MVGQAGLNAERSGRRGRPIVQLNVDCSYAPPVRAGRKPRWLEDGLRRIAAPSEREWLKRGRGRDLDLVTKRAGLRLPFECRHGGTRRTARRRQQNGGLQGWRHSRPMGINRVRIRSKRDARDERCDDGSDQETTRALVQARQGVISQSPAGDGSADERVAVPGCRS